MTLPQLPQLPPQPGYNGLAMVDAGRVDVARATLGQPLEVLNPKGQGEEKFVSVDRWNRYKLPDPVTGEERAYTRVTTAVKALDDEYHLTRWKLRNAVYGMSMRPDLVLEAASHGPNTLDDPDVKKSLNSIADKAQENAGSQRGARIGTGLHNFTDRMDRGESVTYVPPPYDKDLAAYQMLMQDWGLQVWPQYIERIVLVRKDGVELCGKVDRILYPINNCGYPVIADLKTGKDLSFGQLSIAMQLAAYANATWTWNKYTRTWEKLPQMDRTRGLIMHVPSGTGTAELYAADLEIGWEALELAISVREMRKVDTALTPVTSLMREDLAVAAAMPAGGDLEMQLYAALESAASCEVLMWIARKAQDEYPHLWTVTAQMTAASRWDYLTRTGIAP